MNDPAVAGKLLLSVVCLVVSLRLLDAPFIHGVTRRTFDRGFILATLASRLAVFIGVYLILNQPPQSDTPVYYAWTKAVLRGAIPGSAPDLPMHYGPLFQYVTGLAVLAWDSPKAIILQAIIIEVAALPIWLHVARACFAETVVRRAAIVYTFGATPIIATALTGMNQALLSPFLAAAILFSLRSRWFSSGASLSASIILVKFLSLIQAPILLVYALRNSHANWCKASARWIAALTLPTVAIYSLFTALGSDPLGGFAYHAHHYTSGNLFYVLTGAGFSLHSPTYATITSAVAVLGLAATVAYIGLQRESGLPQGLFLGMTALLYMTLLLSKKSFPSYQATCFFAIALTVSFTRLHRRAVATLGIVGVLGSVEPSIWFQMMTSRTLSSAQSTLPFPSVSEGLTFSLFPLVEISLLLGYATLLAFALASLRGLSADPPSEVAVVVSDRSRS